MTVREFSRAGPAADSAARSWHIRGRRIALDRPIVMGIVNVTPDSFSDGGLYLDAGRAAEHASALVDEGADILDVGGESTRPQGARPVSASEERRRVVPVIRAIRDAHPAVAISVDTTKADVARAALDEGADIVNDVSGLRLDPSIGEVAAVARAGLVVMHSRGGVSEMATFTHAHYGADVTGDVVDDLALASARARDAGVLPEHIAVDPGIGFAKRGEHSLAVLAELPRVVALGYPVVVGVSRKRFVGALTGVKEPVARLYGTVGANVMALARGARIFRVHDVGAARQSLDVAWAILEAERTA